VVFVGSVLAAIAVAMLVVSPAARQGSSRTATSAPVIGHPAAVSPATRQRIAASYAALPLAFEPNQGQADPQVKYMARGAGYGLYLTSSQAILTVHKRGGPSEVRTMLEDKRLGPAKVKSMLQRRQKMSAKPSQVAVVRMQLLGASSGAQLAAADPKSGKVNYYLGNDPSKWRTNVPLFGRVSYRNLYPGVDLVFHGAGRQLEFDYLVSPGADASSIAVAFKGADGMSTNAAGDLVLATAAGPVEMHRPVAYQEEDGVRQNVEAGFAVKGANEVAFALGSYDHTRELVIDPTVTFSTYFGGDFADYGLSIVADGSGNAFVAGATDSVTIPGDSSGTNGGSFDVFVTKISSTGTLAFTTLFGGSVDDFPGGIAVDSQGIYVAGTTDSPDFPATVGQTTFLGGIANGNNDAFAAKLSLTTGALSWGTYIAGSDSDSGLGIAVDSGHNLYVVGETFSADLGGAVGGVNPLPNGSTVNLGLGTGADDGYIVKLNSTGTAYSLVSYIGGSNGDLATGVALDPAGNIYVSGETISTDLRTTAGVVQGTCGTDRACNTGASGPLDDAFVVGIQANLAAYKYVTYYGGSNVDDAFAIAADGFGDAFITGATASTDFPTAGTPFQTSLAGAQNAFVVVLNPTGTAANYGSYLGGNGTDFGLGITNDISGNAYVTGQTSSSTFPLLNPTQSTLSGSTDAFVSVLSPIQKTALFSTYLGGGGDEDQLGGSIALDPSGNIYVTGDTDSGNGSTAVFPTTAALDGTYGGGTCVNSGGISVPCTDAFIAAYTAAQAKDFSVTSTVLSPSSVSPGSSATSTVTVTALNGYNNTVTLSCSISGGGSPAPTCALGTTSVSGGSGTTTLTVTTTGNSGALLRHPSFHYAMWLPIAGLSLVGMGFSSAGSRRKKLLGFLMIGIVMTALFLMPACGSTSTTTVTGGCTTCTSAGSYTVNVQGTDGTLTHSATPPLTLTVN
jgi:Beta-propeller repeat